MKGIAVLLLGLSAGCSTTSYGSGAAGSHPPPLPPGASAPKWDHFCSEVAGTHDAVSRFLDEASENGWELVSWSIASPGNLACFKRPRAAAAAPGAEPPTLPAAGTPPAGR